MIVALGLGALTGDSDPSSNPATAPASGAISASAPPRADVDAAPCAKVLAQLPVNLGKLAPRVVRTKPDSPFVVAWGNPAVVLRCGEAKPKQLVPGSAERLQNAGSVAGPYFIVTNKDGANVWTSVDRAAYVSVTIPAQYQGGDIMPPLGAAIAKALPAVCSADPATPDIDKLCARRK